MKTAVYCCLPLLALVMPRTADGETNARPARAILFIIDGLHWQAPDRLELKTIRSLREQGTSIEKAHLLLPYDPRHGEWGRLYTCSMPNPIMLAGTLFLKPDQPLIQDSFYPGQMTAHVTNCRAYESLSRGNTFTMVRDTNDAAAVEWAADLLAKEDIRFLRMHLQDTGSAGYRCAHAAGEVAWRHDIWAEGSPYVAAARQADQLLARFIDRLRTMGKWDDTLLVVTADHGQANVGWHPPLAADSSITPLIFVGPTVARGRVLLYAEHTDIVPTICDLMGVPGPNHDGAAGRILEEVKQSAVLPVPAQPQRTKELNETLREYLLVQARLRLLSEKDPALENVIMTAEGKFYGIDRFLEWPGAGTLDRLIANNRAVLAEMKRALADSVK